MSETIKSKFCENELQEDLARFLDVQGILHCASIGGTNVGPRVGARLKRKGYRKGFPDHQIFEARGGWHGLLIELKVRSSKEAREDQKKWRDELIKRGYLSIIVPHKFDFFQARKFVDQVILFYMTGELKREGDVYGEISKATGNFNTERT